MKKEVLNCEMLNNEQLEQVSGGNGEYDSKYDDMSNEELEKLAREELGDDDHLERYAREHGLPGRYGYRYYISGYIVGPIKA